MRLLHRSARLVEPSEDARRVEVRAGIHPCHLVFETCPKGIHDCRRVLPLHLDHEEIALFPAKGHRPHFVPALRLGREALPELVESTSLRPLATDADLVEK